MTIVQAGAGLQVALNAASAGDEIHLANGTYTGSGDSVLEITKDITIRALSPGQAVLDGEGLRRGVRIFRWCTVHLEGLVFTGGYTSNGGGLYVTDGNVKVTSCAIKSNNAANGGGIFVSGASTLLTITSSSVHQNTASPDYDDDLYGLGNGGGQYIQGGTVVSTHTSIYSNTATGSGPNVYTCCGSHMCTWPNAVSGVSGSISQCPDPPPFSPPLPPSPPSPPSPPPPPLFPPALSAPMQVLPLLGDGSQLVVFSLVLAIAACLLRGGVLKVGCETCWKSRRWTFLGSSSDKVARSTGVLPEMEGLHPTALALASAESAGMYVGSSTAKADEVPVPAWVQPSMVGEDRADGVDGTAA